ncbi:phospholipid carrier-dependent glycosyltransferase [uncultured Georgenia sp.]|uniref:dolichyl-phosphate-mannose--protein mannosyltransferase n=1 Tax=uncultured Georgenia sp. TaxID=378209 RepID=UPI0026380756|nr:phospholipid carrier-dependent glycosyltransferase [uncultured Georgenia sp.]
MTAPRPDTDHAPVGTPEDATTTPDRRPADRRSVDEVEADLRARLLRPGPTDRLWGWLGPLLVTAVAAVLRLVNLDHPTRLIFDETYYVKQAYSLLTLGYEGEWEGEEVNDRFREGDFSDLSTEADYVVHPQIGKWLIAIGIRLFGADNGAGWRFSAAIAGAATVLVLARITRRLTGSTLLGMAAGLLLAVDGLHFTGSRIGLLDVFLGFFVVAALAAVLLDREQYRRRLARACAADLVERGDGTLSDPWGPRTGVRWWLVLAGVLLGLGGGVKWSAIYALAVFGIMVVVWDICARRAVGVRLWFGAGVFRGGVPAFVALVPVAAVTYVAGWFSWFANRGAYLRTWAEDQIATHGTVDRAWLPNPLNSLWEYHLRAWHFHNGLDSEHTYEAHPAGWILQLRPTSFYWEGQVTDGCTADRCVQAITSVGNPVVWWVGLAALAVVLWMAVVRRDWRAWVALAGYAATYLPWFAYAHRTIFTFYAIALAPYVALTIVLAVAWVGGLLPPHPRPARRPGEVPVPGAADEAVLVPAADGALTRRAAGAGVPALVSSAGGPAARSVLGPTAPPAGTHDHAPAVPAGGHHDHAPPARPGGTDRDAPPDGTDDAPAGRAGHLLLAVVCLAALAAFVYFWPLWTGATVPYEVWRSHMWLGSWI